ncbi:MAG TPA: hypothetical protein VEK84_00215 [Terriglobales bacterium]|nr:hypothetical protein [Terriglobales bacterium]
MAFMESRRSQISPRTIRSFLPSPVPERWTPAKVPVPQRDVSVETLATFPAPPPKTLFCTHETFALGDIRRTLPLAQDLVSQSAGASILVITVAS